MIDEEGRLTRIDYSDRVFYDATRGIAGTTYPIGTAGMPSSVIANTLAICVARKLKVIDVLGIVTFATDMLGYTFYGHRHEDVADFISLGGQKMGGTIIRKALVTGAQGADGFLTLEDCLIYALTDFNGIANLCDIYLSMSLLNGGHADLSKCNSVHSDLTITVNAPARASFKECSGNCTLTGQRVGGLLYIRGYKGTLVINDMTGGDLYIYANGADITINANCDTAGDIYIYGDARVTDNHGVGLNVHDYTGNTKLAGWEIKDTHAHADNIAWQEVLEITTTTRKLIKNIWLDFVDLAQNMEYRLSYKIDEANYRVFDSNSASPWTPALDDGVLIYCDFIISSDLKLELKSAVAEGAARDIPYEVDGEDKE